MTTNERLERIERENRLLKRGILLTVLAAGLGLAGQVSAMIPTAGADAPSRVDTLIADTIYARQIFVVDPQQGVDRPGLILQASGYSASLDVKYPATGSILTLSASQGGRLRDHRRTQWQMVCAMTQSELRTRGC
jgi:hypothetical protein